MKHYCSLTIVFNGQNLNYGESFGNVLSLKKLSQKNKMWSYISRQAIRYDIVRLMDEIGGYTLTQDLAKDKGVVQFTEKARIADSPEIDFFGYMKTEKKKGKSKEEDAEASDTGGKTKIRKGIARLSDGISLEQFSNDIDFSTNMGLAQRIGSDNDIYQSEFHKSLYSYTITIELDKVGIDENYGDELESSEKIKRLHSFLEAIQNLYRDIRGKREDLSPVFVIGGIYPVGNPFFYNKIEVCYKKDKTELNATKLNEVMDRSLGGYHLKDETLAGTLSGTFDNFSELACKKVTINQFFTTLKEKLSQVYTG